MKQLIFFAIVTLLLTGCEIEVEIPVRHAGVVVTNQGDVKDQVLRPGKQIVRTDSRVILYDVSHQQVQNEFDFLFKDVSSANVKLAIEFTPIVDSLPGFYKMYESDRIPPVIDVKSRSTVRQLFENYYPTDFSKDEVAPKIIEAITSNRDITNYVKVNKVHVMDMRW